MFRSWQNSLQNLNEVDEVDTFVNEIKVQSQQFKNKLNNKVKHLKNLNAVYEIEDETFAKNLQNLKQSNAAISKSLEVNHWNVKSINIIKQNNKAIAQINQKLARNANRIKQNLKEVDILNKFYEEIDGKSRQMILDAEIIRIIIQELQRINLRIPQGLSLDVIEKFSRFTADQSHVGDQCAICMEDFEIGRNMMRLDCDGQHTFCQVCIEGWFAEHNTCPICRQIF